MHALGLKFTNTTKGEHGVSWVFFLWGGFVTLDAVTSRPCRDSLLEGQLIARFKVTPWLTAPEFRAMG